MVFGAEPEDGEEDEEEGEREEDGGEECEGEAGAGEEVEVVETDSVTAGALWKELMNLGKEEGVEGEDRGGIGGIEEIEKNRGRGIWIEG